MKENVCCRIFKEQLDLIMALPEQEGKSILYNSLKRSYNAQRTNIYTVPQEIELSQMGECIYELLSKNITWKEFSLNHGGKREGSGSKKGHPNNPSGKNQWTDKPKKQPTKEPVPTDEPLFEEFWKAYTPVAGKDGRFVSKGNKKSCQEKYTQQLRKGIKHETIINGLKQYLTYCANNGVCSCGAEVFINQRRWENDYSGTGVIQSVEPRGLHRQGVDIVEAARQFANGT